ncbi:hypothetical protein LSAT2_001008 [Lamellibrachia satsuma]|nr:hypothetical protein LSAT2_001008 [Lamellibrachia satsuma]
MATSQVSTWVRLTTMLLFAGYSKAVGSQPRLYPYGMTRGDTVVRCRSDHWGQSPAIMIPRGVKLFISETRAIVVYTHGYVTLSQRSNFRTPVDIRKAMTPKVKKHSRRYGFAILAPLWTDNDCSRGKTFYHVYDSKKTTSDATKQAEKDKIMNKAKEDIVKYSGELDVTPTWVLVVTWFQVLPRLNYNSERDQPNTYQLVFMSDRDKKKTYVLYLYESVGWDRTVHRRPNTIGYYETRWRRTQWKQLWMSNTTTAFRIADIVGNTGEVGKYFFPLTRSPASTGHTKCIRWYQAEKEKLSDIELRLSKTLPCPCDLPLLIADGRWKFDWKNYVSKPRQIRLCYYERQPSEQPSQVRYTGHWA